MPRVASAEKHEAMVAF